MSYNLSYNVRRLDEKIRESVGDYAKFSADLANKAESIDLKKLYPTLDDIDLRLKDLESTKLMFDLTMSSSDEKFKSLNSRFEYLDHKMRLLVTRVSAMGNGGKVD